MRDNLGDIVLLQRLWEAVQTVIDEAENVPVPSPVIDGLEKADYRAFDLSDVLSVTTGILVSARGETGLRDIMEYMCHDDELATMGLSMMKDPCTEHLFTLFPKLVNKKPGQTREDFSSNLSWLSYLAEWVSDMKIWLGETLIVTRLPISTYRKAYDGPPY